MSQCQHRDRLKDEYVKAVNAYGESLTHAKNAKCLDQSSARRLTQERSAACQVTLRAFLDHVAEHGCGDSQTSQIAPAPLSAS